MFSPPSTGPRLFRSIGGPPSHTPEFDEYVRRVLNDPFPCRQLYASVPQSQEVDLWKNRRFRLYKDTDNVLEGTVVEWIQLVNGPYSIGTEWKIRAAILTFAGLEVDDTAIISEGGPKEYQNLECRIISAISSDDGTTYKVQLVDDPLKFVDVHRDHLKSIQQYTVVRMNVHGGGVVSYDGDDCKYSLEWIDPPSPLIDLSGDSNKACCPICQAVEPTVEAFDDSAFETTMDDDKKQQELHTCPVCSMNDKPLRTLECNHQLCNECWSVSREPSTSFLPANLAPPIMEENELHTTRDYCYKYFHAKLPHTIMDGTATRPLQGQSYEHVEGLHYVITNCFRDANDEDVYEYDEDDDDDDDDDDEYTIKKPSLNVRIDDLTQYWKTLKGGAIHMFIFWNVFRNLVVGLKNPIAIEIVWKVVQERWEEIENARRRLLEDFDDEESLDDDDDDGGDGDDDYDDEAMDTTCQEKSGMKHKDVDELCRNAKSYPLSLVALCFNRLGELCLKNRQVPHALYWFERSLPYAKRAVQLNPESRTTKRLLLADVYNNLGIAQQRSGYLIKAKRSYYSAREWNVRAQNIIHNIRCVEYEITCWTGSSGRIIPGC
ncbi:hypothetical protein IV203_010793 [Nitzschia inconspicua]|uniref:Uncharacterized protein n=1 Tax=Nitzschia inconspicua TaxID=303405 RepID=A0A9K3PL88_9STRA|nr:hypothetical protein IV203_010793 [Nitzschia inconspicua]